MPENPPQVQESPTSILQWDDVRMKELEEWSEKIGQDFFIRENGEFKAAFDLLSPDLINAHLPSVLHIPVVTTGPVDAVIKSTEKGGYGIVCKVEDPNRPGSWLAVKYLKSATSPQTLKRQCIRFVREARIWRNLKHPSIVPLTGVWIDFMQDRTPLPAFVSPWLGNENLRHFLMSVSGKQTPMKTRLRYLLDVLDGLRYMHSQPYKICHGDLCAWNILLDNDRAFICDFGLSRIEDEVRGTSSSSTRNHNWIAPERATNPAKKTPTPESDMFEFGATFWEVITGETPWSEGNTAITRFGDNTPLPQPANMPDDVWSLVTSCMQGKPEDRIKADDAFFKLKDR